MALRLFLLILASISLSTFALKMGTTTTGRTAG
jgi:hypothetical protein